MTRHVLWVATAFTLAVSLLAYDNRNRSLAQETEGAAAAEAAATDADADASADASAGEASGQADVRATTSDDPSAQADTQATTSDDSATQADAQATTTTEADAQAQPADDSQKATSDPPRTPQSDVPGAQPGQGQDAAPGLPAPETPSDPNAPREQSRLRDGQQPPADQGRTDASARGRADVDARAGRDRQNELRRGIQFGRGTDRGLTINHIERNSVFFSNGFRRGDVIVSVHGRPIRSDADFFRFVALQPGQRVPVIVLRDGRRETIFITYHDVTVNRPSYDNRHYQSGGAYLGVTFDAQVRDAAIVLRVNPGSPAQEAGLQGGDIILALNGQEVRGYPDAIAMIRSMRPGEELQIVVERSRAERELVAVLDVQPNVRTAIRPGDVRYDRGTIVDQPPGVRIDVNRRDFDDRRFDGDRDRDRDFDDGRGRRLLPRFRN